MREHCLGGWGVGGASDACKDGEEAHRQRSRDGSRPRGLKERYGWMYGWMIDEVLKG